MSSGYPGQVPPSGGEPSSGDQPPGYGGQQPPPPYGAPPPYGGESPGYGTPTPYGGQPPQYGGQPPQYGGQPPQYGGQPPQYGGQPPQYGGYPPPPGYPGGGYDGGSARGTWSGLAIAALVTGCIPWIGILAAIPLGIVALVKIGKTGQRGKPLAILGMVISVLIWVITIVLIVVIATNKAERDSSGAITKSGRIDFADIRTGDCVKINGLGSGNDVNLFDIDGVPCSESHNAETAGEVPITGDSYPGFDSLVQQVGDPCKNLIDQYVDPAQTSGLQPYLFAPNEDLWKSDDGNHRVVCFVVETDYSSTTDSVAN